jgi:hypothetical protein
MTRTLFCLSMLTLLVVEMTLALLLLILLVWRIE